MFANEYRQKLARIALDEMYQFVAVLDAQGTLVEVNRAALVGAGQKLPDVEGKPFWQCFWWAVSTEIQRDLKAAIARAAQGEFIRYDVEIYGRSGGKETIIIDFSMIPVRDEDQKVVFIVAEGRDITEKKAYEREIARKNEDLQSLLQRIRELDEIKTQFFANVSHELRTPLALIIGPADRLLHANLEPGEQQETAQVIARNAKMLLKHVNDLLDISKLEAGKLQPVLRDTDLGALVRFIASHFEILAAERRVDFRVDAAHVIAAADPEKLQRVVMNLLSNAFKFAPHGGSVRCGLSASEGNLVLSVEDSGPGVKPELRELIFERFRQGNGGPNRQFGGTGLGLAIAEEFVEMHAGNIQVLDSTLGGALFQVTLPLRKLSSASESLPPPAYSHDPSTLEGLIEELRLPRAAPELSAAGPANRPVILVVEDNPDMNRFVVQCLAHDYRVIAAFNGREGLQKALELLPALIVSDLMMPGVGGVEMIAGLREHQELRDTPILLLSAKADDELRAKLLEDGAQEFVTKPFTERELRARVGNLLAIARAREELRAAEEAKRLAVEAMNLELTRRSKELSELFRQAPGFMAVMRGPGHVFELANAAYHRLVGHRDILGKTLAEALPEVQGQSFVRRLDEVLATGVPYVGTAVPLLLQREPEAPLEERFVDFVYQPLIAADGSVNGIFVEGSDVTARKQAEDALQLADRRKDDFLATLAHELRNPLAPIRHAARISQEPHATAAQLKWSHNVIDRQLQHMSRLLDDLLDVSRITRGKLVLRKVRLAMKEALVAAVETMRPLIEARGQQLSVELPPELIQIDADPVRFAQIFANLLTNAAKYTDAGGKILVRAKLYLAEVVVTVQDNGIGIPPESLPGLFEMFSQATPALERAEGGLGIGLSLVRGLLLLHGGTIQAKSLGVGLGSEFRVTLPLAPGTFPFAREAILRPDEPGTRRLRVLVADDNRDSADSCTMLLQMFGHEVTTAYNGREALDSAQSFAPQFALLDIGMPEMNGYEVARQIRASGWGQEMILVAVTGWSQDEDKRLAKAAGFDHHFAKPVNPDELLAIFTHRREAIA
jgi:PAS domain S-box-containing protein